LIFSHSVGALCNLKTISFVVQKFLISCSPTCPFFLLVAGFLEFWSSTEEVLAYTYCFQLFQNCRVSGLMLRSLIHFKLIIVQGDRHGSTFSFLQADSHFSQQNLLKRLSFLHTMLLTNPEISL
jgi:hypothetical protein